MIEYHATVEETVADFLRTFHYRGGSGRKHLEM